MFSIRPDLPYKSFDELKKADRELVAGTTGPGSNAHDFPLLLKEFAGLKLKLVSGYPANSDVLLAIERKGLTPGRRWRQRSSLPSIAVRCALWFAAGWRCRASKIYLWMKI